MTTKDDRAPTAPELKMCALPRYHDVYYNAWNLGVKVYGIVSISKIDSMRECKKRTRCRDSNPGFQDEKK